MTNVNSPPNFQDLTGKVFGRLLVLKRVKDKSFKSTRWLCRCECGTEKEIDGKSLKNRHTVSCGCHKRDCVRKEKGEAGFNYMYYTYENNARHKENRIFELTKEEFKSIVQSNCFYCGTAPRKEYVHGKAYMTQEQIDWAKYVANGVDRVDNDKGYSVDNCVACCTRCNLAKRAMTQEAFCSMVIAVYNNWASNFIKERQNEF